MTGYGAGQAERGGLGATVEVRTVNHRFLDVHARLPRELAHFEVRIQQAVRRRLIRGRVDVSLTVQKPASPELLVDGEAARSYLIAARRLRDELGLNEDLDLRTLLLLPGVVRDRDPRQTPAAADEALGALVDESLESALRGAVGMRLQEGEALQAEMEGRIGSVRTAIGRIRELEPASAIEAASRLSERLAQLLAPAAVDPQRLAQEVAVLAERADISEEIARLESHVGQMENLLLAGGEVGKRMDFLLQETQREVNTLQAKTVCLEIKEQGIVLKAEIEKIREQAQNVE